MTMKMNNPVKLLISLTLILCSAGLANAQEAEMADAMRSNGKIYVVVSIVLLILLGIVVYLFSLERKVSRLEKRLPEKK